jgi:hypothetical protein
MEKRKVIIGWIWVGKGSGTSGRVVCAGQYPENADIITNRIIILFSKIKEDLFMITVNP